MFKKNLTRKFTVEKIMPKNFLVQKKSMWNFIANFKMQKNMSDLI